MKYNKYLFGLQTQIPFGGGIVVIVLTSEGAQVGTARTKEGENEGSILQNGAFSYHTVIELTKQIYTLCYCFYNKFNHCGALRCARIFRVSSITVGRRFSLATVIEVAPKLDSLHYCFITSSITVVRIFVPIFSMHENKSSTCPGDWRQRRYRRPHKATHVGDYPRTKTINEVHVGHGRAQL